MGIPERPVDRLALPGVTIDFRGEEIRNQTGTRAELRPRSFAVLRCLAVKPGTLLTKEELLASCWPGLIVTEDSLVQCISEIRQALGERARNAIRTVPRRGYVLEVPQAVQSQLSPCDSAIAHPQQAPGIAVLPFEAFSDQSLPGMLGAGFRRRSHHGTGA